MADYYTLLTNAGIAYENACKAAGLPIKLTQMSVGDGNGAVYNPAATATALKREVWRGPLNALFQDENNPSWLLAEITIPPEEGGWYVREAGLWTDTGILYAIVKYPESFKPVLATSGSGKEFYIRSIFETSNASQVTLLIDDTVVKATRAWVMGYLADELAKLDGKQSVRVAATGNVVLSGAQQIDGVAVTAGQRVLLPLQTAAKENGIWIAANGAWSRAADANTSAKVTPGLTVMVEEGAANGDSLWHLVTNGPIVLDITALTFEMLAGRTGIAAGTYKSLTVDKYGRALAGANPETLAGFGIKDAYTKPEIEAMVAYIGANGPVAGTMRNLKATVPVSSETISFAIEELILRDAAGNGVRLNNFSKSAVTTAVGVGGMDIGPAPATAVLSIYAIYNPATKVSGLLLCNQAVSSGNTYSGPNMPPGFTFSALVSGWGVDASGMFRIANQVDRQVNVALTTIINMVTVQTARLVDISAIVPLCAREIDGIFQVASSTAGNALTISISGSPLGHGSRSCGGVSSSVNATMQNSFSRVSLLTPGTIYATTTGPTIAQATAYLYSYTI